MSNESFLECPCCLHTLPVSDLPSYTYPPGTSRKVADTFNLRPRHKPAKESWTKSTGPSRYGHDGELFESLDESATHEVYGGLSTPHVALAMRHALRGDSYILMDTHSHPYSSQSHVVD